MSEGTCHHAWRPEFDPQDPNCRKEPTPNWSSDFHMYVGTHAHTNTHNVIFLSQEYKWNTRHNFQILKTVTPGLLWNKKANEVPTISGPQPANSHETFLWPLLKYTFSQHCSQIENVYPKLRRGLRDGKKQGDKLINPPALCSMQEWGVTLTCSYITARLN